MARGRDERHNPNRKVGRSDLPRFKKLVANQVAEEAYDLADSHVPGTTMSPELQNYMPSYDYLTSLTADSQRHSAQTGETPKDYVTDAETNPTAYVQDYPMVKPGVDAFIDNYRSAPNKAKATELGQRFSKRHKRK